MTRFDSKHSHAIALSLRCNVWANRPWMTFVIFICWPLTISNFCETFAEQNRHAGDQDCLCISWLNQCTCEMNHTYQKHWNVLAQVGDQHCLRSAVGHHTVQHRVLYCLNWNFEVRDIHKFTPRPPCLVMQDHLQHPRRSHPAAPVAKKRSLSGSYATVTPQTMSQNKNAK